MTDRNNDPFAVKVIAKISLSSPKQRQKVTTTTTNSTTTTTSTTTSTTAPKHTNTD